MNRITQGENALIRRNLKKADGSGLLLSTVSTLTAEIIQKGVTIESYSYPSSRLRQGATTSQVELEIGTDISDSLRKGHVTIRWTIVGDNALFLSEGIQKDIISEIALEVI